MYAYACVLFNMLSIYIFMLQSFLLFHSFGMSFLKICSSLYLECLLAPLLLYSFLFFFFKTMLKGHLFHEACSNKSLFIHGFFYSVIQEIVIKHMPGVRHCAGGLRCRKEEDANTASVLGSVPTSSPCTDLFYIPIIFITIFSVSISPTRKSISEK